MRLIVVHNHFRPGGVRRVIELATPYLVAHCPVPIRTVMLACGEAPDPVWLRSFRVRLGGPRVELLVEPAFGYVSELAIDGATIAKGVEKGIHELRRRVGRDACIVWAHNLGLGRNLYLAHQLTSLCAFGPLVMHHHDWWFENRWHHFAAMRESGFGKLPAVAGAVLPASPRTVHVAINQADAAVLQKHFPGRAAWLPNPVELSPPPPATRVARARAWLSEHLGEQAPVWLLPCRLLRRKNIAEALLLTRWLRPQAWLITLGGVSSPEEQTYADALAAAAQAHGWRLRLSILHGDESRMPSVAELLAASEALLLTSLQEGFGLPYVEAAAARRPLIARQLPNVAPDLAKFGFTFPQHYREVLVDPGLFDWEAERARQARLFREWKGLMPRAAGQLVGQPALLAAGKQPCPVPFSRLTLSAQLEVLAQPVERSWKACARLNHFLPVWRKRAAAGLLAPSPWPRAAARWLGGRSYARRFLELVRALPAKQPDPRASQAAQAEFLRKKLRSEYIYPLLWSQRT